MTDFTGFPEAALDFYDDLEIDNSKAFWEDHKDVYRSAVAEPMRALTDALARAGVDVSTTSQGESA